MDPGTLAGLIVAAFAALISFLAYVSSSRATASQAAVAAKAVDADAYERARTIYESSLHQLEIQVARLQEQSERLTSQLSTYEGTIADLRMQIRQMQASREQELRELRKQIAAKDAVIDNLRAQIPNGHGKG